MLSGDGVSSALANRFVWDMVVPLAPAVGNTFDLLSRYHRCGHAYVSITIAGDDSGLAVALHRLAAARIELSARSSSLVLATSVEEVLQARRDGKLAVGLHLEGTECLERDVNVIDLMYDLGIRHANLAFNQNNSAAGGCADFGNVGLSRLGRRYLDRMNKVGMLIDLSHISERASFETIEHSSAPVVFTHSNSRALHAHYRNVSDELARACAASGGLVGMSGSSAYIGASGTLAEGLFQHIDHFVQLLGPSHVGLGTDYVVDEVEVSRIFLDRPDEWPVEGSADHRDVKYLAPEDLHLVVEKMQKAGYPDGDIDDILGGNYVRIASRVWK